MNISKRLQAIISMVPENHCTADIGTDHGFVPVSLVTEGIAERAIASDVRKGPLQRAEARVRRAGLTDRIDVRLGDGLKVLSPGEAEVIVIAGMGGMLMIRILRDAPEVMKSARYLVLSPHRDAYELRKFLTEQGLRIEDETMVEEEGKYYPVIRTVREEHSEESDASESSGSLSEAELWFGPVLLKKKPEAFLRYLDFSEEHLRKELQMLEDKLLSEKTRKNVLEAKEKMLKLFQEART